jgi:pyridinium-3,5-bisthiocarboxylic acid mononucleotide nickel chelatase
MFPMAVAYFDCFAGSGGDMIVASLVSAGADIGAIQAAIDKLGLAGVTVSVETVRRGGMAGVHFVVHDPHEHEHEHPEAPEPGDQTVPEGGDSHAHTHTHAHTHPHEHPADGESGAADGAFAHAHEHAHPHAARRGLSEIVAMIESAGLPARVVDRARRVFQRLAEAEAAVHGIAVAEVHFHEVGAVDSIVDVVSACVGLELLGIDRVLCSPIPLGSGTVRCEHGLLPVPAPATARLMIGVPIRQAPIVGEATTPTAAALFTALAESFGPVPAMTVSAIGCGAGTRDGGPLPNLLRVLVGESSDAGQFDSIVELSCNLDDCTGETIAVAIARLLAYGCLDAWASPAVMKKSRPAWILSALAVPADAAEAERIMLAETTTFGVRRRLCERRKLLRHHEVVETPYGPIRVKVGVLDGREITASPEFEDCNQAAERHHVPVREVYAAAQTVYRAGKPADRVTGRP